MTITREQVADLQPGDVVELTSSEWPDGTVVRGPLWLFDGETLQVGRTVVRHYDGRNPFDNTLTLTVISRAPRPLYVNSDRTEPVPGDVVTLDDHVHILGEYQPTWFWPQRGEWHGTYSARPIQGDMPARLRLLVDGETGQVVP